MKKRSTFRSLYCLTRKHYQQPSIMVVKLQISGIICKSMDEINGNANLRFGGGNNSTVQPDRARGVSGVDWDEEE